MKPVTHIKHVVSCNFEKCNIQARNMKPHVSLVNPPYPKGAHQHIPFPQLGMGYLAAVLEKNGYTVNVIDCQALNISFDEFKQELNKHKPDIVGITSITLTYKSALEIAKIAKEVHPNCITVLGGPHVTFWDENALQECPAVDIVVRQEGEYTLLELVQKLEAGKPLDDVIGTSCRKAGKIIKNPDRPLIENLDELPFPARHLVDKYEYGYTQGVKMAKGRLTSIITARGCVNNCNFCTIRTGFNDKIVRH